MSDIYIDPDRDAAGWDEVDTDEIERRVAARVDEHVEHLDDGVNGATRQGDGLVPAGGQDEDDPDDDLRDGLDETSTRVGEAVLHESTWRPREAAGDQASRP